MADADVEHAGGCICGRVRFAASGMPLRVTICHCTWCQRRTGSGFGVEAVFAKDRVRIAGTPRIYRHVSDQSGRWIDQEFCAHCGANLGFTLEAVPGIRTLAAGAFDDPAWLDPRTIPFRHVFARSCRSWSAIPEGAERYEMHFRT